VSVAAVMAVAVRVAAAKAVAARAASVAVAGAVMAVTAEAVMRTPPNLLGQQLNSGNLIGRKLEPRLRRCLTFGRLTL